MRAIQLTEESGYSGLQLTRSFDPGRPRDGQVLVELTAAGVTPLEHTIATGGLAISPSLPLVLGTEGAGVVAQSRHAEWEVGARVAFTGTYGMLRHGTWADVAVVDAEHLTRVPEHVSLATAAAMPVAYLTAYLALHQAGFSPGKIVLAPGAGGSVGNATYQLARAMGAARVITTAGTAKKAAGARAAGMSDVVDLSTGELTASARELAGGAGVDIVIDAIGGSVTSSCLAALGSGGRAIVIGYSAGRTSTIRLTDLIWTASNISGFNLFMQPPDAIRQAYDAVFSLAERGEIAPLIERVQPLDDAANALRHLIEDRPFGKVVLSDDGGRA